MQDQEIFLRKIVEENQARIRRLCSFYVLDEEDRKDLYQDVLHNIWRGLAKFRGDAKVSTWIYRLTVNSALAFLARKRAEKRRSAVYADLVASRGPHRDEDGTKEMTELLREAIARLPLIDMIIISLVLDDASSKEIARVTGLTDGSIRVRIHRAKESLRKMMNGDGP